MNKKKKVLVTGGAGYVGSVLVHTLLENGFAVRVIDSLKWGGESLLSVAGHPDFEFLRGDIRNTSDIEKSCEGIHSIVHLAAIVGDPACKKEPELATDTNYHAAVALHTTASKKGVERFIFGSTCSNYGKMTDPHKMCDENSELKPVSLYAELKVKFENHLLQAQGDMAGVALRFSTAFGLSARMRFDLTVSEFTRDALLKKELVIFGEKFWRPYCHTKDLARACLLMLQAGPSAIHHQAFNVGNENQNYQKQMIVAEIKKRVPDVNVQFVPQVDDPRDYRVNFDKIKKLGFSVTKTVPDGIQEVIASIQTGLIGNPYDKRYSNI